jgi:aminopeptidase N
MHVTVDNPVAVIANGELTETVVHDDGSVRYTYHHPYPISPYLFSFNAGPFEEYTDSYESIDGRTISIASYLFGSDAAWADSANSMMKNMMAVFEDLFGPYPFDRYGMIAVEPFRYGGMEHQTITTMRRQLFLNERVTAHEIAHQWWGNMVTCESWDHIWLNEGFASYAEALYIERKSGTTQRNAIMESYANTYFFEDGTIRYPLYNPPEGYIFGRAIYQKGAWVLHMLRNVVSDAVFYATLGSMQSDMLTERPERMISGAHSSLQPGWNWIGFLISGCTNPGTPSIKLRAERRKTKAVRNSMSALHSIRYRKTPRKYSSAR